MPPRVKRRLGRPPASHSDDSRRRIIEAAEQCFGEQGFEKATNKEITERAGFTSGVIYHHFGVKAELYQAVCDQAWGLIRERLEQAVAFREGMVAKLIAVLDVALTLNREHPSMALFFANARYEARRHPELSGPVDRFMSDMTAFLTVIVRQGIAQGEITTDSDPLSVVGLIQALIFGIYDYTSVNAPELAESVMREAQLLIEGELFLAADSSRRPEEPRRASLGLGRRLN